MSTPEDPRSDGKPAATNRVANRLANETSPYLRQHQHNPVDWFPWGEEAFARARDEDKPILLSVGYSTCHWCHVMAHESFEDEETAALMNERYVCIKVDREERPDVDQIYQLALQLQGEHGGWPLTMFLLPDATPFFGGTYFPKRDNFGRPGFSRVLQALAHAFANDRASIAGNGKQFREGLAKVAASSRGSDGKAQPAADTVDRAAERLLSRMDRLDGGFSGAPKFPNPKAMELILRGHRRARRRGDGKAPELLGAVVTTLVKMAEGGIYDQIGGGFARYSTDARWLVPHFEKMLYDNAQLLVLYAEAFQESRNPIFPKVIRETVDYLEAEMRSPEGGLYTAQDADSEGVEGKYYVFTPDEVRAVAGDEAAAVFCRCYGVVDGGNWQDPHGHGPVGASILHAVDAPKDERESRLLDEARAKLLAARKRRVPPITDDKILSSSNGLAIAGLAEAGRILGEPRYVESARRTAEFVLGKMSAPADAATGKPGRLFRTYKDGDARLPGTLDDHAYVADGLIALYEATGEARWLEEAHRLTRLCLDLFFVENERTFYLVAAGDPALIERPVSGHDGAVPSGMSVCLENMIRLGDVCGEPRWTEQAEAVLAARHDEALRNPFGHSNLLNALDLLQERPAEIVLVGEGQSPASSSLSRAVAAVYFPNRVIIHAETSPALVAALVEGKPPVDGAATAYLCRDHACERPETDPEKLSASLRA